MAIQLRRTCEALASADGFRELVDRLWPRGLIKEMLQLGAWVKDLAPGNELQKWIHGDMTRWLEFKRRYFKELDGQPEAVAEICQQLRSGAITHVFATRDAEHNHAAVFKEYLERF